MPDMGSLMLSTALTKPMGLHSWARGLTVATANLCPVLTKTLIRWPLYQPSHTNLEATVGNLGPTLMQPWANLDATLMQLWANHGQPTLDQLPQWESTPGPEGTSGTVALSVALLGRYT